MGLGSIKKGIEKVESILARNELARDNDEVLYVEYLRFYRNLEAAIGLENFERLLQIVQHHECLSMESITRARRKVQETGKYLGRKRQYRKEEAGKVGNWHNDTKPVSREEISKKFKDLAKGK